MYVYQADTYCDSCGEALRRQAGAEPETPDSTNWPLYLEGSYSTSEADSPDHCASGADCLEAIELDLPDSWEPVGAETRTVGALLSDELTDDGEAYVRGVMLEPNPTPFQAALHEVWSDHYGVGLSEVERASLAAKYLENRKRSSGEWYVREKDGAPDWVSHIHDKASRLPGGSLDDRRSSAVLAFLEYVADNDPTYLDDAASEWADSYVDAYTADRTAWLASHTARVGYVGDAVTELGADPSDTDKMLGVAQYMEWREVAGIVVSELEYLANA